MRVGSISGLGAVGRGEGEDAKMGAFGDGCVRQGVEMGCGVLSC